MKVSRVARATLLCATASVVLSAAAAAQQPALDAATVARIDSLFARFNAPGSAGCALGISRHDTVVFEKGWGRANLEYDIPITPATIFEAGSVSKQFTAAAVLRLAQQGRLSLDDDARKHVPELPAYDHPITIRHLLNHTSGLRDWGTVMSMAGWPRGTRLYTHAHVLETIGRQRALNHPVGAEYLYSNSNYNLLAIIAERVSGKSLAEFTRAELFEPLGMTSTGWRDDFTRIVPGRAQAYAENRGQWRLQMPNENIYGNSSLLTTVGDLLKWSANYAHARVGGPEFTAMQLQRGRLTSGRDISYASGIFVNEYAGTREITHDGATAGYRALFARYPDAGWSIAMLCNAANADPGTSYRVLEIVSGLTASRRTPPADTVGLMLSAPQLARLAGDYRSLRSDEPMRFVVANGRLRQLNGPAFIALNALHVTSPTGRTHMQFDTVAGGAVRRIRAWVDDGDTTEFVPAGAPLTGSAALAQYTGAYVSEEADVTVWIAQSDTALVLRARPDARLPLAPIYRDGFVGGGSVLRFTRDARGRIDGFLGTSGRARGVRFVRTPAADSQRMLRP